MVRQGTITMLRREPNIEIVGEAGDGQEAIQLVERLKPDMVIMDIRMPVLSGIEATRRIREAFPDVHVLVLSAHDDDQYVFSLLKAGASGYLLKTAPVSELVKAIHRVKAGESPLDPAIAHKVIVNFYNEHGKGLEGETPQIQPLTPREMEVLQMLVMGSNNRDIASALYISDRTVQSHLSNIFAKLNVSSRLEAVLTAIRLGWVTLEG